MDQTRLQRLRAGVEAIPQKRRRQDLIGALRQYGDRATAAATVLDATAGAEGWARTVFPDLPTTTARANRRKASALAGRIAASLRAGTEQIRDDAMSNQFALLSELAANAQKALRDQWARHLEERLKSYDSLVHAAESAGLSGGRPLAAQLAVLQAHTRTPPPTEEVANRIAVALASLATLVAQLGLEGPAGEFLVAAASGAGDARALTNPEVQSFVERHALWKLLVVSVR